MNVGERLRLKRKGFVLVGLEGVSAAMGDGGEAMARPLRWSSASSVCFYALGEVIPDIDCVNVQRI